MNHCLQKKKMYDTDPLISLDQLKEVALRACTKVWQAIVANTRPLAEPNCLLLVLPCARTGTASPPLLNSAAFRGNWLPDASTTLVLSALIFARSAA